MLRKVLAEDGVEVAYGDFGPSDGKPIVLCHGLAASGRQFEADARYFAEQGFRVLVPDVRGHGHSGAPAVLRAQDFSIPRMAGDMIAMLNDAGLAAVDWVGNSLGGIIALFMVGAAPERFRTLTTFGTAYSLSLPAIVPSIFPFIYGLFGKGLVSGMTARVTTDNIPARALVAEMLAAFDAHTGKAVASNVRRYNLIAEAQAYDGPILMIKGGRDRAVNAALGPTLRAMDGRSNFSRVDIRDAAHCANLDVPHDFRATLESFWARGAIRQAVTA